MDSGIYRLTFGNQYFYIGKSENIPKRWATHRKNFEQGTHTKKMQQAYDSFGAPEYYVMLECHPDHIDLYESYFIHQCWGPAILNTTKPRRLDPDDEEALGELYDRVTMNGISCMQWGTVAHVQQLERLYKEHEVLQLRVEELEESGVVLPLEAETKMFTLEQLNHQYLTELRRLQHLSWWDRLWNYKVYV